MRFSRQSRTGRPAPLCVALIAASLLALTLAQATAFAGNGGDTGAGPASPALVPPSEPSYGEAQTWYLAEGFTGGQFDTWVLVQNPGIETARVTFDFMLPPGTSAPSFEFDLAGGTRRSFHLDDFDGLADTDVSTRVTSDYPIMVERAMYFSYNGKAGGHDSIGVKYPSNIWYLAEGYTGGDFDTWVLVQNPGEADAHVTLEFQLPPGASADPFSLDLPGGTRQSIHLDDLPGLSDTDVSTKVVANLPVVAERAMYFDYQGKQGGHDSIGVVSPSQHWFLAEGYTGGQFDTWVLVQNANDASARVKLDFQLPSGFSAPSAEFNLPAHTRQSFHLDDFDGLADTDVSTTVTSDVPVVAERAMYFDYQGKTDGHDSAGADFPSDSWYLAEGYTGGDFDTWVLVQNPGQEAKHVTMDFQLPLGASAPPCEFYVPGGTRQSIHLDDLPGLSDTDVSTRVTASGLVVAERAEYFNYEGKDGGSCSIGALYEPPIVPDTTKVLQGTELDHLASAAKSGDGKELVLTFDDNAGALQGIEEGDVIVCGITANTPYGLLQKVKSVNRAGGQVVLNTVTASLEEAVWRGHLYQPVDLSAACLASTRVLAEGVEFVPGSGSEGGDFSDAAHMELPFTYNFNDVKLGTDPNFILLNGKVGLTFKGDFNVDIDVDWPSLDDLLDGGDILPNVDLKSVDFGFTVEETVDIRASASVTKDIEYEKEIVEHEFSPIDVQIGPVPVVLVPYLEVHAGVDGTVSAGVTFGVTQKGSVYAGAAYDSSGWTPQTDKSFTFEWTPPTGSINADFKVYAGPQFGIKLYGVCGPYLNIEPYVRLAVNTATPPLWKVYVGIEVDIGVKAGIELEFEADTHLFGTLEWDWSIELFDVNWDGALRWEMLLANAVKINSLSPTSGDMGKEVAVKGSGFGDTRENGSRQVRLRGGHRVHLLEGRRDKVQGARGGLGHGAGEGDPHLPQVGSPGDQGHLQRQELHRGQRRNRPRYLGCPEIGDHESTQRGGCARCLACLGGGQPRHHPFLQRILVDGAGQRDLSAPLRRLRGGNQPRLGGGIPGDDTLLQRILLERAGQRHQQQPRRRVRRGPLPRVGGGCSRHHPFLQRLFLVGAGQRHLGKPVQHRGAGRQPRLGGGHRRHRALLQRRRLEQAGGNARRRLGRRLGHG